MGDSLTFSSAIVLTTAMIGLAYACFVFVLLFRIKRLLSQKETLVTGKFYFFGFFFDCILEVLLSIYLIYAIIIHEEKNDKDGEANNANSSSNLFLNTRYIPNSISIFINFSLYWQFLIIKYRSYLHHGDLMKNENCPPATRQALVCFQIISFIYIFFQIALVVNYNIKYDLTPEESREMQDAYVLLNATLNLLLVAIFLFTYFFFFCQFSGRVIKSDQHQKRLNDISTLIKIGMIGRLVQGIMSVLLISQQTQLDSFIKDINQSNSSFSSVLKILFICLGVCIVQIISNLLLLFASASNTSKIYLFDAYPNNNFNSFLENRGTLLESLQIEVEESPSRVGESSDPQKLLKKKIMINTDHMKNIQYLQEEPLKRERGMGRILKVKISDPDIGNNVFALRQLAQNYTTFMNEEINNDIKFLRQLKISEIVQPYFVCQLQKQPCILYQCHNISLGKIIIASEIELLKLIQEHSFLQGYITISEGQLSLHSQLRIARDLAATLDQLNSIEPPLFHGHLTPDNIFITKQGKIKISDFCFRGYKKFLSLQGLYENKSVYSPPQILADQGNIVNIPQLSIDIYSFGMIVWSLFQGQAPFGKTSLAQVQQLVAEDNRPTIQIDKDSFPQEISKVVQFCWQKDQNSRMSTQFQDIYNKLDEVYMARNNSVYDSQL